MAKRDRDASIWDSPSAVKAAPCKITHAIETGLYGLKIRDYKLAEQSFDAAATLSRCVLGTYAQVGLAPYYLFSAAALFKVQEKNSLVQTSKKLRLDKYSAGSNCIFQSPGSQNATRSKTLDFSDIAYVDMAPLDYALCLLGFARKILETKEPKNDVKKVEIFEAIGDIFYERELMDVAIEYYRDALSVLVSLAESHPWHVAELNFKICLAQVETSRAGQARSFLCNGIEISGETIFAWSESPLINDLPDMTKFSPTGKVKMEDILLLKELLRKLEEAAGDWDQAIVNGSGTRLKETLRKTIGKMSQYIYVAIAGRGVTRDVLFPEFMIAREGCTWCGWWCYMGEGDSPGQKPCTKVDGV